MVACRGSHPWHSLPGIWQRQEGCCLLDGCAHKQQFHLILGDYYEEMVTEESQDTLWTHGHYICCAKGKCSKNWHEDNDRASSQTVCHIGLSWDISQLSVWEERYRSNILVDKCMGCCCKLQFGPQQSRLWRSCGLGCCKTYFAHAWLCVGVGAWLCNLYFFVVLLFNAVYTCVCN